MSRNVLVVSTVEHADEVLRRCLGSDVDALKVVVPVVRQGLLDWLANDQRAFSRAESEAQRLADTLPSAQADAQAGEADVALAIQDALATFPADEIVVAVHPDDTADFAEQVDLDDIRHAVASIPVRALVVREAG
jgi:hypothetical protein